MQKSYNLPYYQARERCSSCGAISSRAYNYGERSKVWLFRLPSLHTYSVPFAELLRRWIIL